MSSRCQLVVLTGGPGAGKTAILELVRSVWAHDRVEVLPEAATILFSGGFWRHDSVVAKKAVQRAIYHVQSQLERIVLEESKTQMGLCDRGTIDGLAYWPSREQEFFLELGTTAAKEFSKYSAVIHLKTPSRHEGYNHQNPMRTESAEEAQLIDEKLIKIWEPHPRRFLVESTEHFSDKVLQCFSIINTLLGESSPQ